MAKPHRRPSSSASEEQGRSTAIRSLKGFTVRLLGIDAPETGQSCRDAHGRPYPCGAIATAAVKLFMASGDVRCDFDPRSGRYDREIGFYNASDGTDING